MVAIEPIIYTEDGQLPLLKDAIALVKSKLKSLAKKTGDHRDGHVEDLAIEYGDTSETSLNSLGEETQVMIFNVVRGLEESKQLEYSSIESLLLSTFFTNTTRHKQTTRDEVLMEKTSDDPNDNKIGLPFVFDENPTRDQVMFALCWLKNLISDREAVKAISVDEDMVRDILITAAKHLKGLKKLGKNAPLDMKPILDLTILRFPDDKYEYFKLYRLHIIVTKHDDLLIANILKYGMHAQFYCMKVCGEEDEMRSQLSESEIAAAKKTALDYFKRPQ